MKSKKFLCGLVATAIVMGGSLAGCSVINENDVKQVIATVDITKNEDFNTKFGDCAAAVTEKSFVKRDMITSYINGYYQLTSQGYSDSVVFNAIKDALVNDAIVTQYASAYLLQLKKGKEIDLAEFNAKKTEAEKYEYLLGGENSKGVRTAKYQTYRIVNNLLDSSEKSIIEEEKKQNDEYVGSGTRTTPSGIDTLKEDYIPTSYGIYTGYEGYLLADAGDEYEPLDGTNRNTRRKAYGKLISNLKSNYLITDDDDTIDTWELSYVQDTYVSFLQQAVLTEFNEVFEKEQEEKINTVDENGIYTYVQDKYNGEDGELTAQSLNNSTATKFETAMSSLSDTTFLLYSPDTTGDTDNGTFGYVYNILLPFTKAQEKTLASYQSLRDDDVIDESGYFYARNQLLKNITTTDQRTAWFNGETDYSFDAAEYNKDKQESEKLEYYTGGNEDRKYLFFENNLTKTDRYEALDKYIGEYTYNGKVTKNADGSYSLVAKKLTIDDMLSEFSAYINYVLGTDSVNYTTTEKYYEEKNFNKNGDDTEIDYSKLVYASGKVTFKDGYSKGNAFVKDADHYKAMAAVNELQYAYTTDSGVLSQYIGYSVSAYETSYIKEFEYAAQAALKEGVGSFKVCAGDYGWHLIYVTDTFECEGGEAYHPVFTKENIEKEGTFENRFYNWYKDSTLTSETSLVRSEILKEFNTDDAVKVFEDAYKDLIG